MSQDTPNLNNTLPPLTNAQIPGLQAPGAMPPGTQLPNVHPPSTQQPPISGEYQALLDQMKDIELPDQVGIWPLAPGWWLVTILCLISFTSSIAVVISYRRKTAYRREALRQLALLAKDSPEKDSQWVGELFGLLKRTSFSAYPNSKKHVAGLHSDQWLKFLDSTQKNNHFASPLGKLMLSALYQKGSLGATDKRKCFSFAKSWIKHHKKLSPALQQNFAHKNFSQSIKPIPNKPLIDITAKPTIEKLPSPGAEHVPT